MQVRKQELELDMEQWIGSKLGKEYNKAIYNHPVYLTYMENTSCEMSGQMNHKLESRSWGEISIASHLSTSDDTTIMAESKEEKNKEPLDKSERGE